MVEVKSSTTVKPYHLQDCAVQAWAVNGAGYPLRRVELAHVNNGFVYPGGGDYQGVLTHNDVTDDILPLMEQVPLWIQSFQEMLAGLTKVATREDSIAGISCDAWGVDYLLFEQDGSLITPTYHYRDPRGETGMKTFLSQVPWETIYAETGVQEMPLNTLFQLADENPKRLRQAHHLLSIAPRGAGHRGRWPACRAPRQSRRARACCLRGSIASMLLSRASNFQADLIVMGGYGHSRVREIVLGGATREILRAMTVPTLMSH